MAKEIYIFSGLGADERVFQKLDFSGFSINFVKWIHPQKDETIEHYASRLINQITGTEPTLIGLSFGGIMAIEIAKQINTQKIILISSAKTKKEIPFYYRLAGKLKLQKLLPISILKSSNFISNWFFGAHSNFDKEILKQILLDTDPIFLKWAIDKITLWENQTQIKNTFHLHGTNDKILPLHFVNFNHKINTGGHFMVLNKATEINEILRKLL